MSKTILILTPDSNTASYDGRWREVFDAYEKALATDIVRVVSQMWSEPIKGEYDLILPLMAWGYHNDVARFAVQMKAVRSKCLNAPDLVVWNSDKHYLRDLAEAGIRIIPTLFLPTINAALLAEARIDLGAKTVVLKPTVSAGAKETVVVEGDAVPDGAPSGPVMVQPLMRTIQSEGEWSLIYLGGALSHTLLKTPKAGDFRSQPDYGSRMKVVTPPEAAFALAEAVMDYLGRDALLYARVDMVRGDDDDFCLMEVELIEPDLYLNYVKGADARFKAVVHQALN